MSIWGALTGSDAAAASNAAAADTYKKQTAAVGGLNSYADTVPGAYNALGTGYDPYKNAGNSALQQLMGGLGLGGTGGSEAFTAAYRGTPGYQGGLETGTNAAIRGANAGNMLQSGGTLKALQRYGSNYEDQRYGDYFNRLAGLAGEGLQATGAQAGLGAQGLGQQTALRGTAYGGEMNAAGTIGQGQVAGAQAQQTGLSNLLNAGTFLGGQAIGALAGKLPGLPSFGGGFAGTGSPINSTLPAFSGLRNY